MTTMRTSNSHNIKDNVGEWERAMKEVVVVCFNLITKHSYKQTERIRGTLVRYVSAEQTCSIKQNNRAKLVNWEEFDSA
jgi:hypothetical protein